MYPTYSHWILEKEEQITTLTLNRPLKKNRIDETTLSELGEITKLLAEDPDCWAVVLQANGECFSAGVDVHLIGKMLGQDREDFRKSLRSAQAFFDAFEALHKPTIAALHGSVIGGGMILALCCDFRIASSDVVFELPEVKRSIGVIMGTQRITRHIGIGPTKEMVLLGMPVGADRALEINLVNQVVSRDQLGPTTLQFARQFLDLPPLAVGVCKRIINEGQFLDRAGQELEIDAQETLLDTEDFKEAIASFFEKRKADYKGK